MQIPGRKNIRGGGIGSNNDDLTDTKQKEIIADDDIGSSEAENDSKKPEKEESEDKNESEKTDNPEENDKTENLDKLENEDKTEETGSGDKTEQLDKSDSENKPNKSDETDSDDKTDDEEELDSENKDASDLGEKEDSEEKVTTVPGQVMEEPLPEVPLEIVPQTVQVERIEIVAPAGTNDYVSGRKVLKKGQTYQMRVKVYPADADVEYTFTSSDNRVAEVDSTGLVTVNGADGELFYITVGVEGDPSITAKAYFRVSSSLINVNFYGNGGSYKEEENWTESVDNSMGGGGSLWLSSYTPEREGYIFEGWYYDSACTNAVSTNYLTVQQDTDLYAKWAEGVLIRFHGNRGAYKNQEEWSVTYEKGKSFPLADYTPVRDGFEFAGWYSDPQCTNSVGSLWTTTNVDLYAKWNGSVQITFNGNGGSYEGQETWSVSDREGDTIYLSDYTPEREGYFFGGWYLDEACQTDRVFSIELSSSVTVYAKWEKGLKVYFNGNGGTCNGENVWLETVEEGKATAFPTSERKGYAFDKWYLDQACTKPVDNKYFFKPTADTILYAGWLEAYTITYDYNGLMYDGETFKESHVPKGKTLNDGDSNPYFEVKPTETGNKLFMGWMTESGQFIRKDELYKYIPIADEKLTAVWSDYYEIVVDYNDPTGSQYKNRTYYIAQGEKFGNQPYIDDSEEYDGKIFAGWYSEATKKIYSQYGSDGIYSYVPTQNDCLKAQWEAYYTVTYDLDGGQLGPYATTTERVIRGKSIQNATDNVTKDGYVFAGWKIAGTDTIVQNRTYIPTGDVTLIAQWASYWTITYDANGGTFNPYIDTSSKVEKGAGISLLSDYYVSREGFVLAGWCDNPEGTGTVYKGTYTPSGDITLYAKWERDCEVTLYAGEGAFSGNEKTKVLHVKAGSTVGTSLSEPMRENYGFDGWYLDKAYTQKVNESYAPTGNVTLYAKWNENAYTVTLHAGGEYISSDVPGEYVSEKSIQITPGNSVPHISVYRDNYTLFWYLDEAHTKPIPNLTSYIPNGNTDLYAVWKRNVIVSWDGDGGQDNNGKLRGTRQVAEGGSFPISDPKKEGYIFDGWYTETGRKITKGTNIYEDISVVARWKQANTCKVTIDLNGGDPESYRGKDYLPYTYVESGQKLSNYGAPEREDYGFTGWLSSVDGKIYKYLNSVAIEQDTTFTAQWEKGYRITLHADGGWFSGYKGVKTVYLADGPLSANTIFTSPSRNDSLAFLGWSAKPNGTADDVIDLDTYAFKADVDLYAVWAEYWSVTAVLNGGRYLNNTDNNVARFKIIKGKSMNHPTESQFSKEGCTFAGWYLTPDFSGTLVQIPGFVPTEDTWLYVKWVEGEKALWNVHFDMQGGTGVSDTEIADGESLSRPADPNREGYVFKGWYTDKSCTTPYTFGAAVTSNLTLYAGWQETNDLKNAAVMVVGTYTYTGEAIVPELEVRMGGILLTKDQDYIVSASNNTNAGEATVTISAKGSDYEGSKTISFTIEKAEAAAPALPTEPITATLGTKLADLSGNLPSGWQWKRDASSELNQVGTLEEEVIFPAKDDNHKSASGTVTISVAQKSIEDAIVTLTNADGTIADEYVYTEGGITPRVTVKLGEVVLTEGTDYTLSYENNENASTDTAKAAVIVSAIGNYTGQIRREFTIKPAEPSMELVNQIFEAQYGDFLNTIVLPEGWVWQNTDSTLRVGSVTGEEVREFTANFTCGPNYVKKYGISLKVKVLPKQMQADKGLEVKLAKQYYVDNGQMPEPDVTVTDTALGTVLTKNVDYTVTYQVVESASGITGVPYTAVVTGAGNYAGTMQAQYYVIADPYDLSLAYVSVSANLTYTGEQLVPEVIVKADFLDEGKDEVISKTLTEGVDYEAECGENINAGTGAGSVTIKGIAPYTGSKTVQFNILKAENPAEVPNLSFKVSFGQKVSEFELPDGWQWKEPGMVLSTSGKVYVKAVLPETENYLSKEMNVEFTVSEPVTPEPTPTPNPNTGSSQSHRSERSRDKGRTINNGNLNNSMNNAAGSQNTLPNGYQGATKSLHGITVPEKVVDGNWKKDVSGKWSFADEAGTTYTNTWHQIYTGNWNQTEGQLPYSWYLFDEAGYTRTGWVTDASGKTYYLNPVSDTSAGGMVTGWQQIDGKWYYFSEVYDGTEGYLVKSTMTPDGYTVDENGVWDGQAKK